MSGPNASLHHDPYAAPELIARATAAVGSRGELAKRLGLTTEQLRLLCKGTYRLKYSVQFTLEKIIESGEVDRQTQLPKAKIPLSAKEICWKCWRERCEG